MTGGRVLKPAAQSHHHPRHLCMRATIHSGHTTRRRRRGRWCRRRRGRRGRRRRCERLGSHRLLRRAPAGTGQLCLEVLQFLLQRLVFLRQGAGGLTPIKKKKKSFELVNASAWAPETTIGVQTSYLVVDRFGGRARPIHRRLVIAFGRWRRLTVAIAVATVIARAFVSSIVVGIGVAHIKTKGCTSGTKCSVETCTVDFTPHASTPVQVAIMSFTNKTSSQGRQADRQTCLRSRP